MPPTTWRLANYSRPGTPQTFKQAEEDLETLSAIVSHISKRYIATQEIREGRKQIELSKT